MASTGRTHFLSVASTAAPTPVIHRAEVIHSGKVQVLLKFRFRTSKLSDFVMEKGDRWE
jgi:hypothetical protein